MRPGAARAAAAFLAVAFVLPAAADQTLLMSGPSGERLDLVFLGDGYTAAEMPLYRSDVDRFVSALFSQPPFSEHKDLFNVHRVDLVSAQSGADNVCAGTAVDTALDAGYYSTGPDCRLLFTYSSVKVFQAALGAPGYDPGSGLVVVIVNSSGYGGAASAGNYCVVSRGPDGPETMAHELGHSFGLLADEYVQQGSAFSGAEPAQPNVTIQTVRSLIKWGRWIDAAASLPTMDSLPDRPGLYEGAMNFQSRVFRPTFNSKMRNLYQPYDRVNAALLAARMDALLPPTVSLSSPAPGAGVSGTVDVSAEAEDGVGLSELALLADGRPVGFPLVPATARAQGRWSWDVSALEPGPHALTVRATDTAGNKAERSEMVTVGAPGTTTVVSRAAAGPQGTAFLSPGLRDGINDRVDFGEDVSQVRVFDDHGREVFSSTASGWEGEGAASGVYVARLRRRDGSETFRTVVVVR